MKKIIIVIPAIFLMMYSYAQEKIQAVPLSKLNTIIVDKNNSIDSNKLYKIEQRLLNSNAEPIVTLTDVVTEPINMVISESLRLKIAENLSPKVYVSVERKKAKAYIYVPTYVIQNGTLLVVKSYKINVQETNNTSSYKTTGTRIYASNSVLASGTFHTISVASKGMYKIDFDFIKNKLGVEPTTLDVQKIRLFGNGGTMLDENNATPRPDDITENAIEVVDGGDGQFNVGDYLFFYATGPHSIIKDSLNKSFNHAVNIYNDVSFYYLNFNTAVGKRIQKIATPTNANVTVTSYNDMQYYEKDSINLGSLGKQWFGDEFSSNPGRTLTRNYNFNFANIDVATPVTIQSYVAGTSEGGNSNLRINVNGTPLYQHVITPFTSSEQFIVARVSPMSNNKNVQSSTINVNATLFQASSNSKCYLDYIQINARRNLISTGLDFIADWNSVANGNIAQYEVQNATSLLKVLDITDPLNVYALNTQLSGTTLSFTQDASMLHNFVAFDNAHFSTPAYVGNATNQNLHSHANLDYLIITTLELKPAAEILAAHHTSKRGYRSKVITVQEIYNEFSSGSQDVSAIRDYIKMLYDRAATPNDIIKNVLFFGDASFDYKNRVAANTNFAPTYETYESLDRTNGYCTDDFYGFLDDNENFNNTGIYNTLDVGLGRLPITGIDEAYKVVSKIMQYDSPASFGSWKNNMTFNADNGDYNNHLEDAESVANYTKTSLPLYNVSKIYVDAFNIQSTPGGSRVPDANVIINNQLYNGTFLMNYNGHGGALGWSDERIFGIAEINSMDNKLKLPLFITATCDFAQYDNPSGRSAGELLMLKPQGGAIALMTTTQLVYSSPNRDLNLNYFKKGFSTIASTGKMPTLGDAFLLSKNIEYAVSVDQFRLGNFRKFVLLGDPGLPLAFPTYEVKTDSIFNSDNIKTDTFKALGKYTIKGSIKNGTSVVTNFNGVVYISILDKFKKQTTLGNNAQSPKADYLLQNNYLYKGKATVANGKFTCTFVMPKDINFDIDKGKISYYASSTSEDASGFDNMVYIGGSSNGAVNDIKGPEIKAYLNNERFVNGGITPKKSTLIVKLSDDYGINTSGNSIGHDITAVLDNNAQNTYVLNNFFEGNIDDYTSGTIRFPLNNLTVGEHTLKIKAWDILNNSSEVLLSFIVVDNNDLKITRLYNYPNPFYKNTKFMFEHNMPNELLTISLSIYSVSGRIVKTMSTSSNDAGTRFEGLEWDGRDQLGDKLAKGVYVYKLAVKSASGKKDSQYQKLFIIQ
jgi:hypothetical protein